jgi:hypothetical protein
MSRDIHMLNNNNILTNDKLSGNLSLLTYEQAYMKHGSTLFLKVVIYLLGLPIAGVCLIIIPAVIINTGAGMFLPVTIGISITAIPFLFALHQGLLLLSYIDKNTAFSENSVIAIRHIKYCAGIISFIYAVLMPYIVYVADKDDAPGAVLMGLIAILAPLVISVFAAVLERLLQSAIDIKSENDLTV